MINDVIIKSSHNFFRIFKWFLFHLFKFGLTIIVFVYVDYYIIVIDSSRRRGILLILCTSFFNHTSIKHLRLISNRFLFTTWMWLWSLLYHRQVVTCLLIETLFSSWGSSHWFLTSRIPLHSQCLCSSHFIIVWILKPATVCTYALLYWAHCIWAVLETSFDLRWRQSERSSLFHDRTQWKTHFFFLKWIIKVHIKAGVCSHGHISWTRNLARDIKPFKDSEINC